MLASPLAYLTSIHELAFRCIKVQQTMSNRTGFSQRANCWGSKQDRGAHVTGEHGQHVIAYCAFYHVLPNHTMLGKQRVRCFVVMAGDQLDINKNITGLVLRRTLKGAPHACYASGTCAVLITFGGWMPLWSLQGRLTAAVVTAAGHDTTCMIQVYNKKL